MARVTSRVPWVVLTVQHSLPSQESIGSQSGSLSERIGSQSGSCRARSDYVLPLAAFSRKG